MRVTCFLFMLEHTDDSLPVWVCRKGPLSWRSVVAAAAALPGAMTPVVSKRMGQGVGSQDRQWTRTSGKSCASCPVSSPWRPPQLRFWIRRLYHSPVLIVLGWSLTSTLFFFNLYLALSTKPRLKSQSRRSAVA